jgi:hypothetical protein
VEINLVVSLLPFGVGDGKWMSEKISREVFERVIVTFLAMTALLLIFSRGDFLCPIP